MLSGTNTVRLTEQEPDHIKQKPCLVCADSQRNGEVLPIAVLGLAILGSNYQKHPLYERYFRGHHDEAKYVSGSSEIGQGISDNSYSEITSRVSKAPVHHTSSVTSQLEFRTFSDLKPGSGDGIFTYTEEPKGESQQGPPAAENKLFKCEQCSYTCRWKANIRRHMKHSRCAEGKPYYTCPQCSYECQRKADLNDHLMNAHVEYKPFSCLKCNYTCKTKGNLDQHIKHVHMDDKPFICPECNYRCKARHNLAVHMSHVHSDVKPLGCLQCSYRCKTRCRLVEHVKLIHSEDRPYSCPHCGFKCKSKYYSLQHIKKVHSQHEPFTCSECAATYKWEDALVRHIKRCHAGSNAGMTEDSGTGLVSPEA